MNEKWFAGTSADVEKKLKTNAAAGLSRKAAHSRYNKSRGTLFVSKKKSLPALLGDFFRDYALILLLIAALLSFFFGDRKVSDIVFFLYLLYFSVVFVLHFFSSGTLDNSIIPFRPQAKVIRGGKLFLTDARRLVPGDVILIEKGDLLLADARLVTSDSLTIDMALDLERTVRLEKNAAGTVRPDENNAANFVNMVHAGRSSVPAAPAPSSSRLADIHISEL